MSQGKLVMVYVFPPPKGKTFFLGGEGYGYTWAELIILR